MNIALRSFALTAALVAATIAASSPLHAQEAESDSVPRYALPAVTVTATRTAVDRRIVPQRIDLVTATQIDRTGARDVAEALRATTPLDVISFPGLLTGVSVRGFRPQYSGITPRTLVLIDGRPAGTNNLALLDVSGVDRIEVLRGPASALYGSSAMGGVVNVIPRRSTGDVTGSAMGGYGAFGRYDARLRAGGSIGPVDFDLSGAALGQREGYRLGSHRTFAEGPLVKTLADGSTTALPWVSPDSVIDFSEFASRTGSLRVGRAFGGGWRVDVRGDAYLGEDVQNPGDLTPQDWDTRTLKDVERRSGEVQLSGRVGAAEPRLRLYSALEAIDYYDAPTAPHFVNFRTPVRTRGAQAQSAFDLAPLALTVGADLTAATAESQAFTADGVRGAPYAPDAAIRSAAAFAQAMWTGIDSRLTLSAGARADRITFEILETPELTGYRTNREEHSVLSPNAGARVAVAEGVQLYGNVGRAFVTPDPFYVAGYTEQRAGTGRNAVFVTRGNPDLRPERSLTFDLGVALSRDGSPLELDLGYFRTTVEDRVSSTFAAATTRELTPAGDTILATTTYVNTDEAAIHGLEGRLGFDLGAALGAGYSLRLFANGTRILRADERFPTTGVEQRIRNVADLTALAGIDLDSLRRFAARLAARYVGERVDADYVAWWEPGEVLYPPYLVADLSARVRLGARYTLTLDVRNLTDEDYFEVRGYNQPGRNFSIRGEVAF